MPFSPSPAERARMELTNLYARYGYRPYRMSQFEEYSLYMDHKNFLPSEHVIAFTDLDGRMMALKPDVTLSIVRHAAEKPQTAEKLYYTENVFRPSAQSATYKELSQIGLEYIGTLDRYAEAEVIALAAQSLRLIAPDALLEVSHMGFTHGLLRALGLTSRQRGDALRALAGKSESALQALAIQAGLFPQDAQALCALAGLYGPVGPTLARARSLCRSSEMEDALDELACVLSAAGADLPPDCLQLDFSLAGHTDYYNGVMLRGYISGLPRAVLTGGRYDNILRRLGKAGGGIGFAIDLSEIDRLRAPRPEADVDLLVRYAPGDDPAALLAAVSRAAAQGRRVRALPDGEDASALRCVQQVRLSGKAFVPIDEEKGGDASC